MVTEPLDLRIAPHDLLRRLEGVSQLAYLQGVAGHTIIGWNPLLTLLVDHDGRASITPSLSVPAQDGPLTALEALLSAIPRPSTRTVFPLRSAAIGYLGYELRTSIERLPACAVDDLRLPQATVSWYDPLLIYDEARKAYCFASSRGAAAVNDRRRQLFELLDAASHSATRSEDADAETRMQSNMTFDFYRSAIDRIREYIAAGDVYQINFTQRFRVRATGSPLDLFARLVERHPMPLSAYLDTGRIQILSNSPELFLDRRGNRVRTCPIKGTRPRGRTAAEDRALVEELSIDPKERAEHIMIVDLERNDLGRICRAGSVRVSERASIHTYPTLHHMISTVEGTLRSDVSVSNLLRATFPGGSITGAPKIRAMEIIDSLEPNTRGVYTGALGLFDGMGDMQLTLPIRTAVVDRGTLYYGTGGGIVIDSRAEREYAESILKAQGLFDALGLRASAWTCR